MGILDRLMGRDDERGRSEPDASRRTSGDQPATELSDEQALARYRYMLRTAPPETIEQAHAEAFAKLTPAQRRMVLEQLGAAVPASERTSGGVPPDDPQTLARMATRAEMRQPGTMERVFGGAGRAGGPGFGSMLAGSLLGSIAGTVVGSMIAQHFFANDVAFARGMEERPAAGATTTDAGFDTAEDAGAVEDAGADVAEADELGGDMDADVSGDFGGDAGDFGGDL
jgi:hypothetical protein